ncbi:DUF6297 family protein [Kribbella sp. CA-247076]|uniref:DUF6297 family protein n=1 Tax=Kribbella sp. CA-247076 TaxID=3239941 RepID=UPI003D91ABAB
MTADGGPVVFDPADFGAIPSSRALRRWMRTTRRRHADRSFWQIFEDVYLILFTLAMAAASGGNVIRHLNTTAAHCTSPACAELTQWMPWILLPLLVATTLRLLLAIGPVSASRAAGFWLLATPVSRSGLLRPSYWTLMAVVSVVGFLTSAIVWALLGSMWSEVALAAGIVGALLVCTACVTVWAQQSAGRTRWALRIADLLLVAAAIPALVLAFQQPERLTLTPAYATVESGFVGDVESSIALYNLAVLLVLAGAVVLAVVLVVMTARTLDRLTRTTVIAGGDLLAGLAGAASSLDVSMLADVVASRHWRLQGRVRSRRGRGSRGAALVHREFRRILRWPRRLVIGFGLLIVPYAVAGTGLQVLVPVAAGVAGFIAVRPLLDGLRSVCRSTGLVRALGMELRELRIVMAVVPAGFTTVWCLLALPALADGASTFAVAAGILSGTVRQASARPPSYAGPLIASPMGAIPPGLFSQPLRGFDLLLLCLAPVLLGLPPLWAVAIPTTVLTLMFSIRPKTD